MSPSATPAGNGRYVIREGSRRRLAYAVVDGARTWIFLDGAAFVVDEATQSSDTAERHHEDAQALAAPMPATVLHVAVKPGDRVSRGDLLVTLEAMKMELPIAAPRDGVVKSVACREGELVPAGLPLLELE